VKKLLERNINKRYSAKEALNDNWITKYNRKNDENNDNELITI